MKLAHHDDLEIRTIKSFVDVLILKYLKTHPLSSGYQILKYLHNEFNILFSPGTVYNDIYSLERKNLIVGDGDENGRIYCVTEKGERALASTAKTSKKIQELVCAILSEA
jgi:DNA-binding PadR family transcriptional regulator